MTELDQNIMNNTNNVAQTNSIENNEQNIEEQFEDFEERNHTVPTNGRRNSDDTVYNEGIITHVYDNSISYIDSEIHIDGDTHVYRNGHTIN